MKPKVLFVLNYVLGWRTYADQLSKVLAGRDDVEAEIVVNRPSWMQSLLLKRHNLDLAGRLSRHLDPIHGYRGWLGKSIRQAVARLKPDVVHFGPHWPLAALAYERLEVPFSAALDCTRFNIEHSLPRGVWSERQMQREANLLRRASLLFPMSSWAAKSLAEDCGVRDDRIRIVPPSIDLTRFRPPETARGLPRILFIGNDFSRKGGDRLCGWVRGPLAGACELHLVSADPRAKKRAGEGVFCHGRVAHDILVADFMPKMDLLCLPTLSDMSPHVLVEAAAAGLPCVASRIGGIPDLVLHDTTGFLVAADDESGFVAALRRLVSSSALRERMRDQARRTARDQFDAQRNYNRLADELIGLTSFAAR